jgi:hypothetical protein
MGATTGERGFSYPIRRGPCCGGPLIVDAVYQRLSRYALELPVSLIRAVLVLRSFDSAAASLRVLLYPLAVHDAFSRPDGEQTAFRCSIHPRMVDVVYPWTA